MKQKRPLFTSIEDVDDSMVLNMKDVAAILNISQSSATERCSRGVIPQAFRIGRLLRIQAGDLRRYIARALMSRDNATGKLYQATLSLIGSGDIHQRLESAGLTLVTSGPDLVPANLPELRAEYESIHDALTARDPDSAEDGRLQATIRHLSTEDAKHIADRIFSLYIKLLHGSVI